MTSQSAWVTLLVAGIPALASVVAGVFAWRTRRTDAEAQRARDLESRISDRKYNVYKQVINYLHDLTKKQTTVEHVETSSEQAQAAERFGDFSTLIGIYGSDGAVRAFHNFMQAAYHAPPSTVLLRLYGDFLVEARKNMGHPDTTVVSRSYRWAESVRPATARGDTMRHSRPMRATSRTDVTVSEVRGRTVAVCGVATDGNSATDPPTLTMGAAGDGADERHSGQLNPNNLSILVASRSTVARLARDRHPRLDR